jgi:ferredoxin-NADP reductase
VRTAARVEQVIDHAPGLRTLLLRPARAVPRFRPGQFLHMAIDPYDPSQHWPDSRAFSIASSPDDRDTLRITCSAVGPFTRRVLELREGDEVWLKLPYGEFVVEARPGSPTVLVAGGTGVTPFIPYLASAAAAQAPVRLLYGARMPELLVYRDVLDAAAAARPEFRWTAYVEEGGRLGAVRGRLSARAALDAASEIGDPLAATYYLSGPPAMLAALRVDLGEAGVQQSSVRIDAWE